MKDYKYQLDMSSKKHTCPKCGRKTFVLYLDREGMPLSPDVGKCDRKDNCNYHYPPSLYFKDNETLSMKGIFGQRQMIRTHPQYTTPSYIDPEMFKRCMRRGTDNTLMRFLHDVFDKLIGADAVDVVAIQNGVGTSCKYGESPIYWQIDTTGRIRTGKIMKYDPVTGKRLKGTCNNIIWIHKLMNDPEYQLEQCYFGSHKIQAAKIRCNGVNQEMQGLYASSSVRPVVWLYESEKAALIMSMLLEWIDAKGLFVPVASGGCEGFNPNPERLRNPYDKIQALKGMDVVLFPDQGKFEEWKEKGIRLKGFARSVYVSSIMECSLHPYPVKYGIEGGDAIDDVVMRYIDHGEDADSLAQLVVTSYTEQYKLF